jgi:hypothetical protein
MMKRTTEKPPLWQCPKCGHEFVTTNLWHSCGRYSLDDHFVGKAPHLRAVFDRYVDVVRSFGPVTVYAQKTRIVFQVRVRFGGAVIKKHWVEGRVWLRRHVSHPRIFRTESYGRLGYGFLFKLESVEDLEDVALGELLRESYAVGGQD